MVEREAVLEALARVTESDKLRSSPALQNILRYVVLEELEGRGENVKAFSIGLDVLGKPSSFDPQADPVVRVNMGRLRSALETYYKIDGDNDLVRIEIPRGTYRPVFLASNDRAAHETDSLTVHGTGGGGHSKRLHFLIVGLCTLAVGLGTLLLWPTSVRETASHGPSLSSGKITINVYASFGDGSTERSAVIVRHLREALLRNEALSIVLPQRAERSKNLNNQGSKGTEIPVDFLVGVAVRKLGNSEELSIELVNSHTNKLVWARSKAFEGEMSNEAEQTIVNQVTRELHTQIFGATIKFLEGRDPDTLTAQQLFMLATWVPGPARNSLRWEKKRVRLARLAIAKDNSFGPAYSVLADKLAYLAAVDGPSNSSQAMAEALRSAQRALELAASDANAMFNVAQFQWHSGRLSASIRTMKRVLELDPNHALARWFVIVYPYTCVPAPDKVLAAAILFDRSLGTDNPIRWVTLSWLGRLHLDREEYKLALEAERRAAQVFQIPYTVMRHATILNKLRRSDEAAELVLAQRSNWPNIDPEHFSKITMPRLCKGAPDASKLVGFYDDLARSLATRLSN